MWPGTARPLFTSHARVLLAVCLVAACQPDPRGASPSATTGTQRVLRRGLGADPDTLDPRAAEDNAALTVVADLYEGLTSEAADGSIVPGAAESWTTSRDGLSYVFTLRPGLRWSNGDPLTAGHFAAALRAVTAPGATAPNAALLADVEDVEAVDALTLSLKLRHPVPHLPAILSLPVAAPMHPAAGPRESTPVNGPFRLARWTRGERVELERNPLYRDAGRVTIDRVVHLTVGDLATELNLYRTGDLDVTSEVPNALLAEIREQRPNELHVTPFLGVYSYAVNLARLPSAQARRALAMAVDRERMTRQVTGAGEQPALGWVPDGLPGYAPARFEWQRLPYPDAAARAREIWAAENDAGRAPSEIVLCTDASANHRRTAVALADLWRTALGLATEIVELEWNVYLDRRRSPGTCDLVRLGWSADFADPEAFAIVFESGHPQNTLGYRGTRYDELLAQSRAASRPDERMRLLAEAEAQLLEDVPVIPIFFRVSKRLVKPYVTGFQENPLGHVASKDLRLEPRR